MSPHNVVGLPPKGPPPLRVAATAGTGNPVHGSRNEVWRMPAYCDGAPVRLYVKLGLTERAMMVEALCAQIATCLGIGASAPYLVTVKPRHAMRPDGPLVLAFGVEDLADRGGARPVRSLDVLMEMLERLKLADLACALDEWILNDVRSPSDILVGSDANVYLIDHEAALGSAHAPHSTTTNWLADRLLERMHRDERPAFLRRLRGRLAALHRVDLGEPPLATQYSQDGARIYAELVAFLRDRLTHLDAIVSARVLPEQRTLEFHETAANQSTMHHVPR
jgi:hypothetical protein